MVGVAGGNASSGAKNTSLSMPSLVITPMRHTPPELPSKNIACKTAAKMKKMIIVCNVMQRREQLLTFPNKFNGISTGHLLAEKFPNETMHIRTS